MSRFPCLEGTLFFHVDCVKEILNYRTPRNAAVSQGIKKLKLLSNGGMIPEEAVRRLVQDDPDPDRLIDLMKTCQQHRTLDH